MSTPLSEEACAARIRTYVFDNFVVHGAAADIPFDQSLVDRGVIDSYGIVKLATWLEGEFAITIADDEIVKDHFGSIELMARFVARKRCEAPPAS